MIRCRTRTLFGLLVINVIFVVIILLNIGPGDVQNRHGEHPKNIEGRPVAELDEPNHELCIIVPFRDRNEELSEFAPHISAFLQRQSIRHQILVMNQTDRYRFNRASLINVGWREAKRLGCSYLVMHDVDLLPVNDHVDYGFPGEGIVRHISSPQYHPKYNYTKFIGGILMLTMKDYAKVDGMSNKYWGWGMEDDEFYLRIRERSDLNLTRVHGLSTDRTNTFRHIHPNTRRRDYVVASSDQKAMKRKRDRISGLHNVKYTIVGRRTLHFDAVPVRAIDVALKCDLSWTPYCLLPGQRTKSG